MSKPTEQPPVQVLVSSVTREKMRAIIALSEAVLEMAKTLNGTFLTANITNCHISNCETGVSIGETENPLT